MRTQIQITSWQGASKAHICPDLGRCRGHSGSASGCPTRTTEGNARLKRVCSGPRFSNDEIELHGVAPGIRHSAAMARNANRFAGWDCVGSSKATCRPGKCAPPAPMFTTNGRTFVYVDTHDTTCTSEMDPTLGDRSGQQDGPTDRNGLTHWALTGRLVDSHTYTPPEDKQDTKPRAKCLAGLGKALPDVAGCVGGVFWAAWLLGISTGPCRQVPQVPRRESTLSRVDLGCQVARLLRGLASMDDDCPPVRLEERTCELSSV